MSFMRIPAFIPEFECHAQFTVITDVTERVSLIGSTNSLNGGTVWMRQTNASSAYVLAVSNVGYMPFRTFSSRTPGRDSESVDAAGFPISRVVCAGNTGDGLQISASDVTCDYSVFQGNSNSGVNVISGNLRITNSIISAEAPLSACFNRGCNDKCDRELQQLFHHKRGCGCGDFFNESECRFVRVRGPIGPVQIPAVWQ
jgi:hypothetical protein